MKKNLFKEETLDYLNEADINRYIRVYGHLAPDDQADFVHDPARTLELLSEITQRKGTVRFGYTIGYCLVWAGPEDEFHARANTIGRAIANLFIEIMRQEAGKS